MNENNNININQENSNSILYSNKPRLKLRVIVPLIIIIAAGVWGWSHYKPRRENEARLKERQAEMAQNNPELLEKIKSANVELEKLLKEKPNDPANWFELGTNLKNLGDYLGAESALKQAMILDKVSLTALNNLGAIYTELENYKKAEDVYRQMIDRESQLEDGYIELAELYMSGKIRSISDAEKILKLGLERVVSPVPLLAMLAQYYEQIGDNDQAKAVFDQLNPNTQPTQTPTGSGNLKVKRVQ